MRCMISQSTISIHAPHAGSDETSRGITSTKSSFQSTLPMRGATKHTALRPADYDISIHAPHAGSDGKQLIQQHCDQMAHFNPRSPCGERPRHLRAIRVILKISIHAPHAGSDLAVSLRA